MDPLDFLEPEELLRFFHCNKTEMSCMENPHTFLRQLRDHDLIPEDTYKKVIRMKKKENMKTALYDVLDWVERERSQSIPLFWSYVFKDTILNVYPTLRLLRNSLIDGSFQFGTQLPEKEKVKTDERKKKELSRVEEEEEEQVSSVKKKRKLYRRSLCEVDEEQQPGPSSQLPPRRRKKSEKVCFYSLIKKGEKRNIWTWPLYKTQLPVTCGSQGGMLSRERLAKGEKCIMFQKQWITPSGFEKFAGKGSYKNWMFSIKCMDFPLARLIKDGHLKSATFIRRHKTESRRAKRSRCPSDGATTVSEEEEKDDDDDYDDDDKNEEDDLENQENRVPYSNKENSTDITDEDEATENQTEPEVGKVFKVTCGGEAGTLHQKRFASGTRGKCIRTEWSWLTPIEFLNEGSGQQSCWKRDIVCEGKPLCALIEAKVLNIHPLLCECSLCKPNQSDLENQKNDDECCVCKGGEADLVVCDSCPCSFHQKCHLPHVDDNLLGDERPWICTFCVTTLDWRYGDKLKMTALTHQILEHMLECQYLVLRLFSADDKQIFALDPRLYLKSYSKYVPTPMWLEKVAEKLQEKEYGTVGDFVSDVKLIFTNCASYNRANPELLALGDRLQQLFDSEFKVVFNIDEQSAD